MTSSLFLLYRGIHFDFALPTLAVCNKPRPVTEAAVSSTVGNPITQSATLISPIEVPLNPPSLVCQENNDNAAKKSSNNGVFLYVACVVIAFLTIICICLIILSAKLYKKRPKRGTRLASFEVPAYPKNTEETAPNDTKKYPNSVEKMSEKAPEEERKSGGA
ncbi:unnamed protein product [Caenorhabditis auriculariae]|uniref:Uncharacterized protein n=1 Tax=Caenorhabditis auriculariae TaxID=2777116 RepID=A0A8S1H9I3_9PELO|nr:unnamed protein product [Caenorhabditis auriculariae]